MITTQMHTTLMSISGCLLMNTPRYHYTGRYLYPRPTIGEDGRRIVYGACGWLFRISGDIFMGTVSVRNGIFMDGSFPTRYGGRVFILWHGRMQGRKEGVISCFPERRNSNANMNLCREGVPMCYPSFIKDSVYFDCLLFSALTIPLFLSFSARFDSHLFLSTWMSIIFTAFLFLLLVLLKFLSVLRSFHCTSAGAGQQGELGELGALGEF